MKKRLTFRLIVMLLTASVLLSSTGLLSMFASAEELTETTTAVASTGNDDNETKPTRTPDPEVTTEGGKLNPTGPTIGVEGGSLNAEPQAVVWLGIDGTTNNMGKASNPYDVSDAAHFLDIQSSALVGLNSTASADKYFHLTADIDLSAVTIGDFTGYAGFSASLICLNPALATSDPTKIFINLEGNNFKIKNLNVTNINKDSCAIFGFLSANSVLSNIRFENCALTDLYASTKISAVVAVQNAGTIQDCSFAGSTSTTTLNMSGTQGDVYTNETFTFSTGHVVRVGFSAFVGDNKGTIQDCYFSNISITVNRRLFVGAVAAQNTGTITGINGSGIAAYGISGLSVTAVLPGVLADMSANIGGIAGKNHTSATISDCTVYLPGTNAVNAFTYGSKVGGIAGVNAGGVSNCYVRGKVTSSGTVTDVSYDMKNYSYTFGGITGENAGSISSSSAENIGVYFSNPLDAVYGGITGANAGNGTTTGIITNCYASGKQVDYGIVPGTASGYYLGGIVGSAETGTLLSGCYALVSLSPNARYAGALIGNGAKNSMLSAASRNYWSRQVSGWPTQCSLNGSDSYDLQRAVSAVNVAPGATNSPILKSVFTHTWGGTVTAIVGINSTSAFSESSGNLSITEYTNRLEITGGSTAGTYGKINYSLSVQLPAGVGASVQAAFEQVLSIDTVVTAVAPGGTGIVSLASPVVISNAVEFVLMKNVNYINYKLGDNITVPAEWRTGMFSGTLDGNGKTITTDIPVFSRVYGARDATVPVGGGSDTPANLAYGYIYNFNLVLTANITATDTGTAAVLGSVMGGTVKNVDLTGSTSGISLIIPPGNLANMGGLINEARGNAFIYGCFTNLKLTIQNSTGGGFGGLIGNINGDTVTVQNCGSNADVYSTYAIGSIGSLIGRIANSTGVVKDCFAAGLVQRGGFIAVGNKNLSHLLDDVYWSVKDTDTADQATVLPTNDESTYDSIIKWAFDETTGYVSSDESAVNIILPAAISKLAGAQPGDFTVTVADADLIDVGTLSVAGGKLSIQITKHPGAPLDFSTLLTLVHNPTELKARVQIEDGISKVGDYWQIKTAGDYKYFCDNQDSFLPSGTNCKVKLVNDIDMNGYTVAPIGSYAGATPFSGVFDGNGKTISNLSISGTGGIAMFGYLSSATIKDLTLAGTVITSGTGQYAACLAAVAIAGIISNVTVEDSQINSTYSAGANQSYIGGVVGAYLVGSSAELSGVTIDNLAISIPAGGFAGGVVGNIFSTTVAISGIDITDLNLTGTQCLGGVVGYQLGNVTISGVDMVASVGSTPKISGTAYVGGVVGKSEANAINSKITDCQLTGIEVKNTGTVLAGTGATGGIAAWFSGTVGDDPATTGTTEYCVVTNCVISGMVAGGIVGRADISTNNLAVTLRYCTVNGSTSITALATELTGVAGGIFGDYVNGDLLTLDNCVVQSGVTVNNGKSAGGILGTGSLPGTTQKLTITNCQSFATISTAIANSYAGAIVGSESSSINGIKVNNCIAGGSVSAILYAGGILGFHSTASAAFNLTTAGGTPYTTGCYVTALVSGATQNGKIWGSQATVTTRAFNTTNITSGINYVVFSSYPQNISAFGLPSMNAYPVSYADINKPNYTNFLVTAAPVTLTSTSPYTLVVNNPVSGNTKLGGFAYDAASSWRTTSQRSLAVNGVPTETSIDVTAIRTNSDAGVYAVYKNTGVTIYPTDTSESLTFRVRIPVDCQVVFTWPGGGTAIDPWLIQSTADLNELRNHVLKDENNADYFGGYYEITTDLVFTAEDFAVGGEFYRAGNGFEPIAGGSARLPFVGSINGNGFKISGLVIKNPGGTYTGLIERTGAQLIRQGGADVTVSAALSNITISSAAIEGDNTYCTTAGVLVAKADNTAFSGITINKTTTGANTTLSKVTTYAGGIVGLAASCTLTGSSVSYTNVTVLSGGMAGGIAGRFGGSIGAVPSVGDYDVQVNASAITGDDAGGIVGNNYSNVTFKYPLAVNYALVSNSTVKSNTTSDSYAAGGILGAAGGFGAEEIAISITNSKVASDTSVTAVCIAGGIVGRMGISSTASTTVNMLLIDRTESYAAVLTTAAGSGTSNAGGIVGNMTNALIVKITNGVAGGSVKGNKYVGGVIAYIEGNNSSLALIFAINSLVSNFVVSAGITTDFGGALMGMVLGNTDNLLMPTGSYPGSYPYEPFQNIKYSSYQYIPGRNMIGNSFINSITAPNYDFKSSIIDLNRGYNTVATDTYKGLRHDNGDEQTYAIVLGNAPLVLNDTNMLIPVFPVGYGFVAGSTFEDFTDTADLNFTLASVTSAIQGLTTSYDLGTGTLTRVSGDGAGDILFNYANGLKLALTLVAFSDLDGTGSSADPYKITRTRHFKVVRALPSRYYEQMNNLDFTAADFQDGGDYWNNGLLWEPLKGNGASAYFTGQYNGGGHTISGMKIARPGQDYVGLFAKLALNSKVYNLTISNAQVTGQNYAGVLAGEATGTGATPTISSVHVLNSSVTTSFAARSSTTPEQAGGLVAVEKTGVAQPTSPNITDCSVTATTVTAASANDTYAGGIASTVQNIENCAADNVTVTAGLMASGIAVRSSITGSGAGNPMKIKGCSVTGILGVSQITANFASASAVAGGILAFSNKKIQLTVESCSVSADVIIRCLSGTTSGGTAGGIMGAVAGPTGTNASLTVAIKDCESYAGVTGRVETGGILGAIKGSDIRLANILVEGCAGGGEVTSTSPTTAAAGGIIGFVNRTGLTAFTATSSPFIKDCIASALVSVAAGTKKGKLVGDCTSLTSPTFVNEANYPTVFDNNYVSSYPVAGAPFGDALMSGSQNLADSVTDLMLCKQLSGPAAQTFTVRNVLSEYEDYYPIAIATYNGSGTLPTGFKAKLQVWDGATPVELAANQPVAIDAYHDLTIDSIAVTTSAIVTDDGITGGSQFFSITPTQKQAGYVEVGLGYGIKVSVPLVTFEIGGTGIVSNPFQLATAEHLTLMYYLPNAYYKQVDNIGIVPADYAAGVYNPATGLYDGRGVLYNDGFIGFRPVGTLAKPFSGTYNGQNYRISGLYSSNREMDYVGFFGYASGTSSLSNIHIELTANTDSVLGGIVGKNYVGGLAGYCASTAAVVNCSVSFGNVAGKRAVGGLIGMSSASLSKCFTACDVLAVGQKGTGAYPGEAGGLVGRLYNDTTTAVSIAGSFATGSIYSGNQHAGGLVGRVNCTSADKVLNISNSFFTGDVRTGDTTGSLSIIIGSGDSNVGTANSSKLYVAGTNVSFKSALLPVTNLAGAKTDIYFDQSVLGLAANAQSAAQTTAQLTSGTLPSGFSAVEWTGVAGSYPRLKMADAYSNTFCALAALPLQIDAKELLGGGSLASGAQFQPKIAGSLEGQPITFTASKLDITDTLAYPAGYDPDLYGNGSDRRIDMLFGAAGDSVTVYRNIFKTNTFPTDENLQLYGVERSELWYDCKTPVIKLAVTVDGVATQRRIKIPLKNESVNHFYFATERQLKALSTNYETAGTKFNHLLNALTLTYAARVELTADVNLRGVEFEPIKNFRGIFDGNEFTVSALKITKATTDYVGLFDKLESFSGGVYVEVNNLNIKDAWVTGRNNVGAITGTANNLSKITNCKVYPSGDAGVDASFVTGALRVGGFTGEAQGQIGPGADTQKFCRSAVDVTGVNTVGGLVGLSGAVISNSFATGDVNASITNSGSNLGVGGFAGYVSGGSIAYSFASGNVLVSTVGDFLNNSKTIGIGGFTGVISSAAAVSASFASGNVRAEDIGQLKMTTSSLGPIVFGAGGFTGVNQSLLTSCYSSSSVFSKFTDEVLGTSGSTVAAGVGGVSGVALNTVSDAYSSGGVLREVDVTPVANSFTWFENAIGGVIGTKAASLNSYTLLYFDIWNNSIGSTLTAIGGVADTADIRSLTTDQMCISQAVRDIDYTADVPDLYDPAQPLQLGTNMWSFNAGAYPCLLALVQQSVSPFIRYPAALSVVSVTPDQRDTSARTGNGLTMAITTPNSLTILTETYLLDWSVSADSEVYFMEEIINGGTTSRFVPIRTDNSSQNLSLVAEIKDNNQYGSRRFDKLCAEMLGTEEKPYLISNKSDLQHIAPLTVPNVTGFENYYNTWYSPVTITGGVSTNVEGKVYFRLLSNVDMVVDVNYTYNGGLGKLEAVVDYDGDLDTANDNHYIGQVPANYGSIAFKGVSFAGNDYTIKNFTSSREFIYAISDASEVKDVSFENLDINSLGTPEEDNGTALVRNNFGIIDGCMILSGDIIGGSNVAGIVVNNFATYSSDPLENRLLTNSTVNANITGKSYVGGIAAKNITGNVLGTDYAGQITNCAYTGGQITITQLADTPAIAGGIAGANSAVISNCFSLGSVLSADGATIIGGFVGANSGTGVINAAYTRTNVSGNDYIGGFAGTNTGVITNAFSAGRVTVPGGAAQTGIFCGLNGATITDGIADKAMAGKATYKLTARTAMTENIMNMSAFSAGGTANTVFTKQTNENGYPQLTGILALDDSYVPGDYVPLKVALLTGYSALSAATVNTLHSQYIDTLAAGTVNPLSVIPGVTWTSSTPGVAAVSGNNLNAVADGSTDVNAATAFTSSNGTAVTATLLIPAAVGTQNPNFGGGTGSVTSPYQINSADSFSSVAYYGPDAAIYYELTNDIDYNNSCPPTAITEFAGHLNGQKYVVYDLTVNNNSGLFKHLGPTAGISNLGLVGAKTTAVSAEGYAGLLAGHAQGAAISNCYAIGEIELSADYIGGLVGYANAGTTITACMTSGRIVNTSAAGAANTGGLAGCADTATLTGCFSSAYVKGAAGNIGGIAGRLLNTSSAAGSTFTGMVMDTALANGASVPAVSTIGNIAGNIIDGYTPLPENEPIITSTITGCSYDKQITLIADANAAGKFTAALMTGAGYTVAAGLSGGSAKFAAGVDFAAMPVKFLLGSAAGATRSFSRISIPAAIAGDDILVDEIPQHTAEYLTIGTGSPIIITLADEVDLADVYATLKVSLDSAAGTEFDGIANDLVRYIQPRLNRIIKVTYTITNATGVPAMDTRTIAIQIKNRHTFAGEPVTYSSDAFTNVALSGVTPAVFEDLLVSTGSIYAAGELPAGYSWQVAAKDQGSNALDVTTAAGEYGYNIALKNNTTDIEINYTIVSDAPWGVYTFWNSLVDLLVQ